MIPHKRFFLIITTTVMIFAAIAVVPMHKQSVSSAAASSNGSSQNKSKSAAGTARTATLAAHDDGSLMIGANSLSRLTAQFWRWAYSIPAGVVDPGSDSTGVNCGINQKGDVWFLAGPASGDSSATCTVPAGKTIVSAVYASIDDYPCPDTTFQPPAGQSLEDFLLQDDQQFVDGEMAAARLDGAPLRVKRIMSRLFSFTAAASRSAFDPCVTGSPQLGVSDGLFVFIDPLPSGDHFLRLNWSGPFATGSRSVILKIR